MSDASFERYFSVMSDAGYNAGNLRYEMTKIFDGVSLEGRSVLDIGAGDGLTSLYAASAGATRVVGLEPQVAGSTSGTQVRFERSRDRLGAGQVLVVPATLQAFDAGGERFDVLVSRASINHLDEDACIRLQDDPEARRTYSAIFGMLSDLATPGGALVIADCSRSNLFATLGVKNPLARSIEWQKHQPPELWATLLSEAGFHDARIRWTTFNTLKRPGQRLFGHRVVAYLTTSTFLLTMRRA